MENLTRDFGEARFLRKIPSEEPPIHQKSSNRGGIEVPEKNEPRTDALETIDDLINRLNLPENYKIADKIIGDEGFSQNLAKQLLRYSEKFGHKNIAERSSLIDILKNEQSNLQWIERIKKGKISPLAEQGVKQIQSLREYFALLEKHPDFEKMELNNSDGFLSKFFDRNNEEEKEKLGRLRTNKTEYVKKCQELLDGKV